MSKQRNNPLLSISFLASRNKDSVQRCLDSLTPIREQLPCELIVVDTSKDSDVHQMLLEHADQVVEFDWCNDFSKARNAGLALATGEWFLYLDDDEWFVEIDELLEFFLSGNYKKYGCANYIQRNYHDKDYTYYSDSWVSRIIKREENTHFRSKIHEYLYPATGKCINLHVVANHSGYIFTTEADRLRHYERNAVLLKQMIEEEPENLRWRVQLVQEYNSVKYWNQMAEFSRECLAVTKDRDDEWDCRDIGTFYAGLMEALINQKQYDEAIQVAGEVFQDKRMNELCQANMLSQLAKIYYHKGNWKKAVAGIEQYFVIRQSLESNPRRLEIQQGALLVEETFDEIPTKRIYAIWISCGLKQKDTTLLREHFHRLGWDKKVIYMNEEFFYALTEAMATMPFESIFVEAMQCAWNNRELQKKMFCEIEAWKDRNPEGYANLLKIAAKVEGEQWYLWYARILTADRHEDDADGDSGADMQSLWEGFCRNTPDVFAAPEDILAIMRKNRVSLQKGYRVIPFEKWTEELREYLSKVTLPDILITEQELSNLDDGNIRFSYALLRIAEIKALYSAREKKFAKKREWLQDFAEKTAVFCNAYYQPEVLEAYPELLPTYVQAGLLIGKALGLEQEAEKEALAYWKEAAVVHTAFGDSVKAYLTAYAEEKRQHRKREQEEMEKLENQVLKQVQSYVEQSRYEEALGILKELRQIKPQDLTLVELLLSIRLKLLSQS